MDTLTPSRNITARNSQPPVKRRDSRRASRPIVLMASAGFALGLLSFLPRTPAFLWNYSPSVPIGLYRIAAAEPGIGDLAVVSPDQALGMDLTAAGLPHSGRLLIKPVAARTGDQVCRWDLSVSINGETVAEARHTAPSGRALPEWRGCERLSAGQLFLLSPHPSSFDGRYFGPVDQRLVVGAAFPVLTFGQPRPGVR